MTSAMEKETAVLAN